ncbi:hypothetical protein [Polaromonas sp.]|uniref:hypothetical protein n=1 Tax=Polaromonas sp. TaxID=1869339 RepID=UPI002FCC60F5
MTAALATSIVGLIGGLLVAAFTYWSTKRRERDAEWRKEKLSYYKVFVESLSGVIEGDDTPEGHKLYAKATNNLLLFAPQSVIEALNAFRSENAISNTSKSPARHDELLAQLLLAIRSDIGVQPMDNSATFKPILWASGARQSAT